VTYEAYVGKKPAAPGKLDRRERGELNRALKAADSERRLYEAEVLMKEQEAVKK